MAENEILAKRIAILKEYFGYFDSDIVKLVSKRPEMLNLSKFDLDKRVKALKTYGFSKDQVAKAILKNPSLLTMHSDDLLEKILAYKDINLDQYLIDYPIMLNCPIKDLKYKYMLSRVYNLTNAFFPYSTKLGLQSVNKTHARLQFLLEKKSDELNDAFISEKDFVDKYMLSGSTLIEKYPLTKSAIKQVARKYEINALVNSDYPNVELSEEEVNNLVFKTELKSFKKLIKSQEK